MADLSHLVILNRGVKVWNQWIESPGEADISPDFSGADLVGADLYRGEFFGSNFSRAKLNKANFLMADLRYANLSKANLRGASLFGASLVNADLTGANLTGVVLSDANLHLADLSGANLTHAQLNRTIFGECNLSKVKGLNTVRHFGPSTIGIETFYKTKGTIPAEFLQGCGVPDEFITYIPSLIGSKQAIQFHSCFISYSHKDEQFANRLYSRMRDEHLRVWFAPEEMKGGDKLHEQIERAIQVHDRLLLILSENSMQSEWVTTEIRRARKTEIEENRRKLFPISIVDFDKVKAWKCFDADSGKDLAIEVREYYIPDFSDWKEHDAFEKAFARLLRDLKAEEKKA